jgi:benzoate-CoA ligase
MDATASNPPSARAGGRIYNATDYLLGRNLAAGRGAKMAVVDDNGGYTYDDLARRVDAFAAALVGLNVAREQRILLALYDTIDFPTAFLGAIKAGIVPVAANTLLTPPDYDYMLRDSRAVALVVSEGLLPTLSPVMRDLPDLRHVIVSGGAQGDGFKSMRALLALGEARFATVPTSPDEPCFWLYSSGSTGAPKGTVHVHTSLEATAELYGKPVLGIQESDVVFSAAKLFFAYGLGNGLTFPMSVGATAVLMAERPTPAAVFRRLVEHRPTIFYGVPTLYAAMLASPDLPAPDRVALRRCASAGEALPAELGNKWRAHFGVDILDGIGSTEMLHIFLSNRPGAVKYGTTGRPVPGYDIRLTDESGNPVAMGEIGDLWIGGPSSAKEYWNQRDKTRATFQGWWTRSGDKYSIDADGYYVYAGRSDDMLKVSGQYVSPVEVESALITHRAVLEAGVVGHEDEAKLTKPKAFVVLKSGFTASPELAEELQVHVKKQLAPYKYPRWIEFVPELPKTATGKIQRFKLRAKPAS